MNRNLVQMEVFSEAVPFTLIMTYLMARALGSKTEGSEIIVNWRNLESHDSLLLFLYFRHLLRFGVNMNTPDLEHLHNSNTQLG